MSFIRPLFACAVVAALSLPGPAQARPIIEGAGSVAKKIHAEPRAEAASKTKPGKTNSGKATAKAKSSQAFVWPVVGAINTPFGGDHAGIDIEGITGDKILASRSGTVTFAGDDGDGYGTKVIIRHPGGYETLYSHLSSISVSEGPIEQGEVVGLVGCTGSCTGDHLHFEILVNGTITDPLDLLS